MSKETNMTQQGGYYQPLFDLLHQEHGLTLFESEMADIIHVVEHMTNPTNHSPAQGKGEEKAPNSYYQPLFDLLNQEHGLLPLETEMRDIVEVVNKMQAARAPAVPVSDAVEFAEWIIKNNYYHVSDKYESYWCAFGGEYITKDTTELYTLFLNTKTNKQ